MAIEDICINGRPIGQKHKPYIIAEISCNHNGSIDRAYRIMERLVETGVDAVKLQTYEASTITLDGPQEFYQLKHELWNKMSYFELYKKAETPFHWMEKLFAKGRQLGLTVFSTPFDLTAVDVLEQLDAPAFKIASFENGHLPLIERVARTGKPMIISTGMIGEAEMQLAVDTARKAGCKDIILLHCVSAYPGKLSDLNLSTIPAMSEKFGVQVGLSNHYIGPNSLEPDFEPVYAAFQLGATVLEMHVMDDDGEGTFDDAFSIQPKEFKRLVDESSTRTNAPFSEHQQIAVGKPSFSSNGGEEGSVPIRPAIKAARAIKKGETFTAENLVIRRPNVGLEPKYWDDVIGLTASRDIEFADGLVRDMIKETVAN